MIDRQLAHTIAALTRLYPVLTITGPRQSGKTTLCRHLFADLPYYNLEDAETLDRVRTDPKDFLATCGEGAVIDEAHHLPELFSYIQVAVDAAPARRFVITGSSNFSLLERVTQSLAGRTALLTLLPLALGEVRGAAQAMSADQLMLRGGYPRLWDVAGFPAEVFYRNYYATYVERDVRQIVNVKDMAQFQKFIRLCAGRIGSEFNASALSCEVGVAVNTVRNWLSLLAASYIAYQLPPYYANIGKRLVKTPKLYFHDVGLACYLLRITTEEQLHTHPLRGSLFENMVVNEAVKGRANAGKDADLYFYRDRTGHEVDLLHERQGELWLYEVKSAQTFHEEFFRNLDYVRGVLGAPATRAAVVYDGQQTMGGAAHGLLNFRDFSLA